MNEALKITGVLREKVVRCFIWREREVQQQKGNNSGMVNEPR